MGQLKSITLEYQIYDNKWNGGGALATTVPQVFKISGSTYRSGYDIGLSGHIVLPFEKPIRAK